MSCFLAGPPESLAAAAPVGLFGSKELYFVGLARFAKWRAVVQRYQLVQQSCRSKGCEDEGWNAFIDSLRGLDRRAQLVAVNARINQPKYVPDSVNWSRPDYWETPFELLRRGGDCEDYAVAKFLALRALGVRGDEMRVVVLWDRRLHRVHAVLAVYLDGRPVMLDNQSRSIESAERPSAYVPLYSINEEGWWLHKTLGGLPRVGVPAAGPRVESSTARGDGITSPSVRFKDDGSDRGEGAHRS